jgi:hypothetical protein
VTWIGKHSREYEKYAKNIKRARKYNLFLGKAEPLHNDITIFQSPLYDKILREVR